MWTDDITRALKKLNGFGRYKDIYEQIQSIRKENLPNNWQAVVRRTIQEHSSDSRSYLGRKDLFHSIDGIGQGVWGLRKYRPKKNKLSVSATGRKHPDTAVFLVKRIIRDTNLTRQIKLFRDNTCEICGLKLQVGEDLFYSEAHHVKPLGKPHHGPDMSDNILVVYPNCHALCDGKWILLDARKYPSIHSEYIEYHNQLVKANLKK